MNQHKLKKEFVANIASSSSPSTPPTLFLSKRLQGNQVFQTGRTTSFCTMQAGLFGVGSKLTRYLKLETSLTSTLIFVATLLSLSSHVVAQNTDSQNTPSAEPAYTIERTPSLDLTPPNASVNSTTPKDKQAGTINNKVQKESKKPNTPPQTAPTQSALEKSDPGQNLENSFSKTIKETKLDKLVAPDTLQLIEEEAKKQRLEKQKEQQRKSENSSKPQQDNTQDNAENNISETPGLSSPKTLPEAKKEEPTSQQTDPLLKDFSENYGTYSGSPGYRNDLYRPAQRRPGDAFKGTPENNLGQFSKTKKSNSLGQ